MPFGFASILFGRTLKGSIFGGLKAISELSIIADKCQKEVLSRHLPITLHKLFLAYVFMLALISHNYGIGLFTISQEFPLQELFTHEVSLTDINQAFELMKQPNCVKVVIKI